TTISAGDCIHLAWSAFAIPTATTTAPTTITTTGLLACCSARRTTTRGVRQSPARIKLLLANGEGEFSVTVATIQGLIGQCHVSFSIPGLKPTRLPCIARLTIDNLLLATTH